MPEQVSLTQDKPGVATTSVFIVNNGDRDMNVTSIELSDSSDAFEYTLSTTDGNYRVGAGGFVEARSGDVRSRFATTITRDDLRPPPTTG